MKTRGYLPSLLWIVAALMLAGCTDNGPKVATPTDNASTPPWDHTYSGDPGSNPYGMLPQSR